MATIKVRNVMQLTEEYSKIACAEYVKTARCARRFLAFGGTAVAAYLVLSYLAAKDMLTIWSGVTKHDNYTDVEDNTNTDA